MLGAAALARDKALPTQQTGHSTRIDQARREGVKEPQPKSLSTMLLEHPQQRRDLPTPTIIKTPPTLQRQRDTPNRAPNLSGRRLHRPVRAWRFLTSRPRPQVRVLT